MARGSQRRRTDVEDRAGSTVIRFVAGSVAVLGVHLLAQTPAATRVVRFVPIALPEHGKPGECQASLAAAYRNDAFRCTADNTSYDPCFATAKTGYLLCDVDPRKASSGTLVLSTTPSPPPTDTNGARTRAWLFELTDGTLCRPLLDNRREVDGGPEIYSCKWAFPGEADAVLGELDSSTPVWTIHQVTLNKKVEPPTIKSLLTAPVKTVWQ
jgi:hypothetical protein